MKKAQERIKPVSVACMLCEYGALWLLLFKPYHIYKHYSKKYNSRHGIWFLLKSDFLHMQNLAKLLEVRQGKNPSPQLTPRPHRNEVSFLGLTMIRKWIWWIGSLRKREKASAKWRPLWNQCIKQLEVQTRLSWVMHLYLSIYLATETNRNSHQTLTPRT